jgi:hypothetical protein
MNGQKLSEWLRKRNKQPTMEDFVCYEGCMERAEAALAAREDTERPDDDPMPVFTIQGKDLLAVPVILYYQRNVEGLWDSAQAHWVEQARLEIEAWQKRNPDRCKYADHKHVPVVQDTEQEHVEPVE